MTQIDTSWVSQTILNWLSSGSSLFLAEATSWLHSLAIVMLVMLAARWGLESLSGGASAGIFGNAGAFLVRLIIATFMLHYYASPLPWGGSSFSGLIPNTATTLAAKVDQSATATVLASFRQIEAAKPSMPWEVPAIIDYGLLFVCTLALRGMFFLLDTAGFVAIGIAVAVGSLSIPFFVTSKLSWLFWNWIGFLISSSMFSVVGAVLGALWSNILLNVLNHIFQGNYSVIDAGALVVPFACLCLAMAFTCLSLGAICAALYGGASSSFDNFGRTVFASAKGAF